MDKFLINGPCKIKGNVSISGSKNASLPILAATLLFEKPVVIKNLPRVRDINTMLNLLKSLGSKIILSRDKKTAKIIKYMEGALVYIDENNLSELIFKELNKIDEGEYTNVINIGNNFMILKIEKIIFMRFQSI